MALKNNAYAMHFMQRAPDVNLGGQVVVRKEAPLLPRLKQGEVSFPLFGQGQASIAPTL